MGSLTDAQIIAAVRSGLDVVDGQKKAVTIEEEVSFDVSGVCSIAPAAGSTAILTMAGQDWEALGAQAGVTVQLSGWTASGNNQAFAVSSADGTELILDATYSTVVSETDVTARIRTINYNPWTGTNSTVVDTTVTKGWVGMYTLRHIQDSGLFGRDIQAGDQRLTIDRRDSTVEPNRGAIVTVLGERFTVVDKEEDPFGLVTILQLRRVQ